MLNCSFQSTSATLNFCFQLFVDDKMLIVAPGCLVYVKGKERHMKTDWTHPENKTKRTDEVLQ